jgi:hypothetical protein
MRLNLFAWTTIASALLIGAMFGVAILNVRGTVLFAASMAAGAAVGAFICSWWPGLEQAPWKLWPMAVVTNPMFLLGVVYSIERYECLVGRATGWECILSELGLVVCALCLFPPAIGLVARWWQRRRRRPGKA